MLVAALEAMPSKVLRMLPYVFDGFVDRLLFPFFSGDTLRTCHKLPLTRSLTLNTLSKYCERIEDCDDCA